LAFAIPRRVVVLSLYAFLDYPIKIKVNDLKQFCKESPSAILLVEAKFFGLRLATLGHDLYFDGAYQVRHREERVLSLFKKGKEK